MHSTQNGSLLFQWPIGVNIQETYPRLYAGIWRDTTRDMHARVRTYPALRQKLYGVGHTLYPAKKELTSAQGVRLAHPTALQASVLNFLLR